MKLRRTKNLCQFWGHPAGCVFRGRKNQIEFLWPFRGVSPARFPLHLHHLCTHFLKLSCGDYSKRL